MGHLCNPFSSITPILSALLHFPAGLAHHLQLQAFVSCSQGCSQRGVMMCHCPQRRSEAWAGCKHAMQFKYLGQSHTEVGDSVCESLSLRGHLVHAWKAPTTTPKAKGLWSHKATICTGRPAKRAQRHTCKDAALVHAKADGTDH